MERGAHIVVHNKSIFPMVKFQGIDVQTGSSTKIGIERTFYNKLSYPYTNCREDLNPHPTDSFYYIKTTEISPMYYQRLCYEIYIQINAIIPKCNCADPSVLILNLNNSLCKNRTQLECVDLEKNKFNKTISNDDCSAECNSVEYSVNINSASFPTKYYSKILENDNRVKSKIKDMYLFTPSIQFDSSNTPKQINSNNNASNNKTNEPVNLQTTTTRVNNQNNIRTVEKPIKYIIKPSINDTISSLLKVSIYYENLRYTLNEEKPSLDVETLYGVIGKKEEKFQIKNCYFSLI